MRWGTLSFREFRRLAQVPGTGVSLLPITVLFDSSTEDPIWRDGVSDFRQGNENELPVGFQDAYVFETSVIEMPLYLEYMTQRIHRMGGSFRARHLENFKPAFAEFDIVVNCTGLGARELARDEQMYASRGQIVRSQAH